MANKGEIDHLAATHALRAASLLLDWDRQTGTSQPDNIALTDALVFARLALKRHAETQPE